MNNSNLSMSQPKKGPNNFFPFLPPTTTQNNSLRPTSMMNNNFLSTQNGQSQMINGDMGQNFPPMNVKSLKYFFFKTLF
jgi:hypothetical protein